MPEPERRRSVDMFRDLAEEMGIEFVEEEPEPGSGMMITPAPPETEDRIPNV